MTIAKYDIIEQKIAELYILLLDEFNLDSKVINKMYDLKDEVIKSQLPI